MIELHYTDSATELNIYLTHWVNFRTIFFSFELMYIIVKFIVDIKVTRFTKKMLFLFTKGTSKKKQSLLKNALNPFNYIQYTIYKSKTTKFYSAHFKVLYLN